MSPRFSCPVSAMNCDRLSSVPHRRGGFTLIELVISLALLSLVLTLVFSAFFQISGGAAYLKDRINDEQELRLLLKLVTDDLMAVQYLENHAEKAGESGIFAETEFLHGTDFTAIHFHAAVPARFHRQVEPVKDPRLHEVGYRVVESADGTELVLMRREDFYIDDDMRAGGVSVPLMFGITEFLVEFLQKPGTSTIDAFEDWRTDWRSNPATGDPKYPASLRLTVGVADSEGKPHTATLTVNLTPSLEAGSQ